MRTHHLLRIPVLAAAGTGVWWYARPPGPGLPSTQWWHGLGWFVLAFELAALALRALTFFTGPAWWCALVTDRVRAGHRYRRAHGGRVLGVRVKRKGRKAVPAALERATFWADRYRCIYCGAARQAADPARGQAAVHLCWDHIKPHDRGGKVSPWNGGTLCGHDNCVKSDVWVYSGGRAYYNPVTERGFSKKHLDEALDILAVEMARRRHPVRLARLVFACLIF